MARKTKKKSSLNTDLDDSIKRGGDEDSASDSFAFKSDDDFSSDSEPASGPSAGDLTDVEDYNYKMGEITVGDNQEDEDAEFKEASRNLLKDSDEDGEEDINNWEEDVEKYDIDPFLDMDESYDGDNPYSDDDYF